MQPRLDRNEPLWLRMHRRVHLPPPPAPVIAGTTAHRRVHRWRHLVPVMDDAFGGLSAALATSMSVPPHDEEFEDAASNEDSSNNASTVQAGEEGRPSSDGDTEMQLDDDYSQPPAILSNNVISRPNNRSLNSSSSQATVLDAALSPVPSYLQSTCDVAWRRIALPTAWNHKDKCALIELSHHGLRAHYMGNGKSDGDAAAVRANHPMSPRCGLFYFEITIVNKGRDGYIGIGFMAQSVSLIRLPGWENLSYGYHGDDGHSFCCSGTGKPYGPTFSTGDVVGCCINFADNSCFYTKNGVHLGIAFRQIQGVLFPAVGLRTPGEVVEVNFGQRPFVFDIEHFARCEKFGIYKQIQETSSTINNHHIVNALVMSYLVHHGYVDTARVFAERALLLDDSDKVPIMAGLTDQQWKYLQPPYRYTRAQLDTELNAMNDRKVICDLVLHGEILSALDRCEQVYPGVLSQHPQVLFQLKLRHFIELVAKQDHFSSSSTAKMMDLDRKPWLEEVIHYGRSIAEEYQIQLPFAGKDYYQEDDPQVLARRNALYDAFSLLAYRDPRSSPVAHLLDTQSGRAPVAASLNAALLESLQHRTKHNDLGPPRTACELLWSHARLVMRALASEGVGKAGLVHLQSDLMESGI